MDEKNNVKKELGFKDTLLLFFKSEKEIQEYKIGPKIVVVRKIILILSILMMCLGIIIFSPSIGLM
jgi:preprotein translocase subunit Sec61beta